MPFYHKASATKSLFEIPCIDLAVEGFNLAEVAECFDISPGQLADSIARGWFPEGETINGRKVWHPDFLPVLMCLVTTEISRGLLPESWPIVNGRGPFVQADEDPSSSGIARAWRSLPMDVDGEVSLVHLPGFTKVYFSRTSDASDGWEIGKVAEHFRVTVGQLQRCIAFALFPDARLVDGRMIWLPDSILKLADVSKRFKSVGWIPESWPALPESWGEPISLFDGTTAARPKVKVKHPAKKRKAA